MGRTSFPIEPIFSEALNYANEQDRSAYLKETCAGDASNRTRVEALLAAHENAGAFLGQAAVEVSLAEFLREDWLALPEETRTDPERTIDDGTLDFLDPPKHPGELGRFADYPITRFLGRGGAGIVLEAFDERLSRVVAVKILAPEWAAQANARERFLREARAAAAIKHENVVSIYHVDESARLPYLVLEFVAGPTLQDRLGQPPALTADEIVQMSRQAAAGLAAAHAQRLVHRDVKPANILIDEYSSVVKLSDFGLARTIDDERLTQEGVIAGTPQYMSPEQAKGAAVEPASDLFSLGSVMYAMAAGHPPFRAEGTMAVLRAICDETPIPLASLRPDLPPAIAQLIHQLLSKEPAGRPASAEDVVRLLNEIEQSGNLANPKSRPPSLLRNRPVQVGIGLMALGAGAFALSARDFWKVDPSGHRDESRSDLAKIPPNTEDPQPKIKNKPGEQNPQEPKNHLTLFDESIEPYTEIRRMIVAGVPYKDVKFEALAVSRDGARIYASAPTHGIVCCWSTEDGEELIRFGSPKTTISHLLVSPDGSRLIGCGGDRTMRIWNAKTGKEITRYTSPIPLRSAALSPDGTRIAVSFWGGVARRIDKDADRNTGPQAAIGRPPDTTQVHIFDAKTLNRIGRLAPPSQPAEGLAWSPDGTQIAVGTMDGKLIVFDVSEEAPLKTLAVSTVNGPTYGVRFSSDGKRLYAAGIVNLVKCWTWPEGQQLFHRQFPQSVVRFELSEDERWMAIAGHNEVRLWSLQDPEGRDLLFKLEGHTSPIRSVAFVPNYDVLVSAGWDGTVRLWRLPPSESQTKD